MPGYADEAEIDSIKSLSEHDLWALMLLQGEITLLP